VTIEATDTTAEKTPDELIGRLFEATLGAWDLFSVYLGDRLGLYRALHAGGPTTAGELAARTGIDGRYALEWLEQQAATGFVVVDDTAAAADERRFELPEAYAAPLLDLDSPFSVVPLARSMVACGSVMPALLDAYRTGGGVAWSDYGADMIEAQGAFNRPWLTGSFGTEILPSIPGIGERLAADPPARVADVACGVGWAAIAIARAYPTVQIDGFDLDESSIGLAKQNARDAGVDDRVTFQVVDVADADAGAYDLAVVIEAIHDMSQPVGVLASIRRMLRPDGAAIIADEKSEDSFTAPAGDLDRFFYGFSILTCLPGAMTERPTAAIGTAMRAATMERLGLEAGFRSVERLDEPALDTLRFYRMAP
jgi:2-polyprenyl-3-methyl-5-hydroxy-6-metoxy-1,4-benzoquinol methylase